MNPHLQQVYEELLQDEPRSRLEPYHELILRSRRQGKSYRRIAKLLTERCGVAVTYEAVRKFLKLRARPRKVAAGMEADLIAPVSPTPAANEDPRPEYVPPVAPTKMTTAERAEQLALRKTLLQKSDAMPESKKRYEYDADKPLTLERKEST